MSAPTGLRAGLIGLGAMGRNHARVLNSLDGVQLVGIMDPAPGAQGPAGVPVVPDIEQFLALNLDYAVVACPTGLHEEIGLRLAAEGVHALIEKPLAPSVQAAVKLADAFDKAGLVGAVGHIERYNPALQSLRTRLEAGELGDMYQIVTRRQGPFPGRIADVGVVMDLATHDIDLTAWVTGRDYENVAARTVSRSGRPHEDMVSAVASLGDGLMANHLVNWLSPFKERSTSRSMPTARPAPSGKRSGRSAACPRATWCGSPSRSVSRCWSSTSASVTRSREKRATSSRCGKECVPSRSPRPFSNRLSTARP